MKNSFFSKFTPKEGKFYPLLEQLSEIFEQAAAELSESLKKSDPSSRSEAYRSIKRLEHEGDSVTQTIMDELSTTFITPFDREDIHALASELDDLIDAVNSCAKRISIYNPRPICDAGIKLSRLICKDAELIKKAMLQLEKFRSNPKELRGYCKEIHDTENAADDVYEFFIKNLFETENDTKELIKIKDIMLDMERTTDLAERVGKILNSFIIKYS